MANDVRLSSIGRLSSMAWLRLAMPATAVAATVLATVPAGPSSAQRIYGSDQLEKSMNGASASVNWSGYADTGSTFTNVAGSWIQPTATCPSNASQLASFWVGIDGYSSKDDAVEQIGTDSDCAKTHGKGSVNGPNGKGGGNGKGGKTGDASYYAWYEFYPQLPVFLSTSTYPVAPGDSMSAQVSASGASFTLTLTDSTEKWTYSTVQTLSPIPAESSAEWIAESPQACSKKCGNAQLADFGSVSFSGASANGQAISSPSFTDEEITMEKKNGKVIKAQPSALSDDGTAFSITWEHT